ncbi:MAG TPA: hypothetical protein VK914_13370 [bacterium]|jgi:hypothetical protein|nr:hypothetical protein [bacterium]
MNKGIVLLGAASMLFGATIVPPLHADQFSGNAKNTQNSFPKTQDASKTLCCRIGKHESYLDKKMTLAKSKGDALIIQNIMNALTLEAANKYNISPEPELTTTWNSEVAFVASRFQKPIDYDTLSPKVKRAIKAKRQQIELSILGKKVRNFIIQDIAAHDANFTLYYTSNINQVEADPALLSQYRAISARVASEGGYQVYENKKINEWWIKFIETENVSFGSDRCKEIFERIWKNGPKGS